MEELGLKQDSDSESESDWGSVFSYNDGVEHVHDSDFVEIDSEIVTVAQSCKCIVGGTHKVLCLYYGETDAAMDSEITSNRWENEFIEDLTRNTDRSCKALVKYVVLPYMANANKRTEGGSDIEAALDYSNAYNNVFPTLRDSINETNKSSLAIKEVCRQIRSLYENISHADSRDQGYSDYSADGEVQGFLMSLNISDRKLGKLFRMMYA